MKRRIIDSGHGAILAFVGAFERGVAIEEIHTHLGPAITRRTLQRRLAELVARGELAAEGRRGGCRYHSGTRNPPALVEHPAPLYPTSSPPPAPNGIVEEPASVSARPITISATAAELRAAVSRPLAARPPVGYNPGFLEAYRPNESAYLLPAQCARLAALGRLRGAPQPAGTYLRKVLDRLLIDLAWNSSRLEGNTYSLLETERLLQLGVNAAGRETEETQMILNHKAAIEMLADQADEVGFNRYTICNLHAVLAENLIATRSCGRLRDEAVGIGGSAYRPLEGPQLIEEQFHRVLENAARIDNPFEQAFFAMVHLPYLQAFADVNKRVSRLAANIPLLRHNLCPLSFVDVPQEDYVHAMLAVYELNRIEYLRDVFTWAYERSCIRHGSVRQLLGEPDPFRLRYRTPLAEVVAAVVRDRRDKATAIPWIARAAELRVPTEDRGRFVALVEGELSALHEGCIARFRLRPSEYHAWKAGWDA